MNYGILSLLPAFLVIIFALVTKRTFEALLLGTFATYIVISGPSFLTSWISTFFQVATDHDVQWVIIICGLFGSLIALLKASNGVLSFSRQLSRICRSGRISLLMTWFLGILIFIDDYLNIITLGSCMLPLTKKYREPREALAYVIDSTGAPVCVILPFSTWAIFYASIFYQQEEIVALGYGGAANTYIHVIPFTFYAFFTLLVVLLFCLKLLPRFGYMKTAYEREKTEISLTASPDNSMDDKSARGSLWDFLIPILVIIIITVVSGEMLLALIVTLLVCLLMYLPRHIMSFTTFCDTFMEGFCSLIPTIAVVFAAFLMQHAADDIQLPAYVISVVQPFMCREIFPALVFILVSILTFITGSNWGIPAVCTPIIIPLGCALSVNPLLAMAAILSGGTFGSHACFYSDATTLTSSACEINNMDHALSQIPYALIGAALSAIAFLICGFIM